MGNRHGHSRSRTYKSWDAMIQRCSGDKNKYYGGRGIGVCQKWSSFEGFLADMGARPPDKTLDRIDSNLGYYKENCRWATKVEQQNNTRWNVVIEYQGRRQTVSLWAEELQISKGTLDQRFRKGLSAEQILAPVAPGKSRKPSRLGGER